MRISYLVAGVVMCASCWVPAWADSITIDGEHYRNVLVYKSRNMYYVQIPQEGRIVNAPLDEVDDATVEINDDPYYRDRLKSQYDQVREARESGQSIESNEPLDPAFQVVDSGNDVDVDALLSGGGGGGLGIPRTQLETMLSQYGAQFSPGPKVQGNPSVQAQIPGGSIQLIGPPNKLVGMVIRGSGTQQQMQMGRQQMGMLLSQVSPADANQIRQIWQELDRTGSYEMTQDGAKLSITQTQNGQTINVEVRVMAL